MVSSVSVIIPSYQTGEVLKFAVESALMQPMLADLIVVDNGNPEDMLHWLRDKAAANPAQMKLITGHGNIGFGAACNLGVKEATGDILLFLNPDALLPEGALPQFVEVFTKNEAFWAAGANIRNADGSEQRAARRNLLTPQTAVAEALRLDKILGWPRLNLMGDEMPEEVVEVPAISGACIAIRRGRFEDLMGFDTAYFIHVEDSDLFRRIAEAGGKIAFLPKLEVLHLQGSSNASSFFVEWQKAKGFMHYFRKFTPQPYASLMSAFALVQFAEKSVLTLLARLLPEKKNGVYAERRLMWLRSFLRAEHKENPNFKGKTYLVTGATSQVGICTIGHLLAAGAKVVAVEHKARLYFTHPNLSWISGDLERGRLSLSDVKAEALIHCAPMWMLKNVLSEIFNAKIKRVIAFSSTSVFVKIYSANAAERDTVQALENAELNLAERCQKAGASFTILRPTMIYGLGLDENVTQISDFARRYLFFPLFPPADGRRMPVHAEDLAQIVLKILDNARTFNKSYNIGGGEVLTYRAMVDRIFSALGLRPRAIELKFLPNALDFLGKWVFSGKINGEMARRMNSDMVFFEEESGRDFAFRTRGFLTAGKHDLGQY